VDPDLDVEFLILIRMWRATIYPDPDPARPKTHQKRKKALKYNVYKVLVIF
jgi:hypothetical protein